MSSRAAVDTNILVKLYSATDEQERLVAEALFSPGRLSASK